MAKRHGGFEEERQTPFAQATATAGSAHSLGLADDAGLDSERLKVGPGGRVVIPAAMREAMGVAEGDTLLATLVDGELRLLSMQGALQRARAIVRSVIPAGGPSVVDELIADRRREQALEDERNR